MGWETPESPSNPKVGGLELGSLPLPQALTSALHNPPFLPPPPPEPRTIPLLCYFSPLEFPSKNESPPEKFPLGCGAPHQEGQTRGAAMLPVDLGAQSLLRSPLILPKSSKSATTSLEKPLVGHSPVQLSCLPLPAR